ncbi:MAG: aquaporin family protein [Candidatus Methanoperedens sp.]|jgi:glycerol uptake facilitator protein|nr:aquaporin family protein [Candidatus Methanoperedens sp.]PKL53324.1 MAG: aquaporin [Candidatus Methanoperedenaceae archaeon HGW-Methanoperedenaceae-1]
MAEIGIWKRSLAELIGTYALVFIGAGAAVITLLLAEGQTNKGGFNIGIGYGGLGDWLAIGLAFGFIIMCMIYVFGHISGTHINPAVTIALWATKRFPSKDVVPYIAAQLAGAVLGAVSLVMVLGPRAATIGGLGATAPFLGVSYGQAILSEAIATFFLMLTIMGVAVDKRAPGQFAGFAIGMVVAVDIIVTGNITGSSLNPARTFGPYLGDALFGGPNLWQYFPIYIIGPIAGAVIAAFVYDYIAGLKEA